MASEGYTQIPQVERIERLLPESKVTQEQDIFDVEIGQQCRFDSHLLSCCGKCDSEGWMVCLLACCFPCLPFGQNASRSLGKSTLKYTLLLFTLTFVAALIGYVMLRVFARHVVKACDQSLPAKLQVLDPACHHAANVYLVIMLLVALFWLLAFVTKTLLGATVRSEFRRKFNIPGTTLKDFCIWWWCSPCALCQETRTVWSSNIREGEWHGAIGAEPTDP